MAITLVAFVAAVLLLVVAVAWPLVAFDDNAEALSDRQVQRLKGEAHHWSSIPPLKLQISAVDSIPTQRDGLADGTITWRTVFGIPYEGDAVYRSAVGAGVAQRAPVVACGRPVHGRGGAAVVRCLGRLQGSVGMS